VIGSVLNEVRRRLSERSSQSGPAAAELQARRLKAEITRLGEAVCSTSEPPMTLVRIMSEKEKSLSAIEARLA
jgi:hypothetical protein